MKAKPADLIFISQIKRDGSGVLKVPKKMLKHFEGNKFAANEEFQINSLSITEGTYVASGFDSYVVKLKKN